MTDHPTILYYAHENATTEGVHEALLDGGSRVIRSTEPADALVQLMDEGIGLLLVDGGSLTPFTERLFRQWQAQDPLLEVVGIAASGDQPEPGLLRMDCRRILQAPVAPRELLDTVGHALERRDERARLVRGDEKIASLVLQATQALVTAVELKDAYTRGRSERVAVFAGILAEEVGGMDVDRIRTAARIMDVGKTGVPEPVLNKTERLTQEEFEQVQRHPVISWEMLRHLFRDDIVLDVARHHHERWDGRGYPDGLAGEAISREARVVAIADSLDAITSTRAFRQARLWTDAVDEVVQGGGTRYDPQMVKVLERTQERMLVGA